MLIRPLERTDFEQWFRLWRAYQHFYKADIPEQVSRTSFDRMLDRGEPMFGALAGDEQNADGLVHWILHRSNWSTGDYCYLQDLYVDERARGHGVGRALIEHVYAEAKRSGCSRVYWLTHETNKNAMLLYDRIGERSGFIQYKKLL